MPTSLNNTGDEMICDKQLGRWHVGEVISAGILAAMA